MLTQFSYVELALSAARARELERRLELVRQLREGRPTRVSLRSQLLCQTGDVLIALGHKLSRRCATTTPAREWSASFSGLSLD